MEKRTSPFNWARSMNKFQHLCVSVPLQLKFTNVWFWSILRLVLNHCLMLFEASTNTDSVSILATVKYLSGCRGAWLYLDWQQKHPMKTLNRRPRPLVDQSAPPSEEADRSQAETSQNIFFHWLHTTHLINGALMSAADISYVIFSVKYVEKLK